MPFKLNTRMWVLVAAATSSVALGQLVTPPPANNPDPEKDIPKAPAPPPMPAAKPPVISQAKPVKEPAPNIPWKQWEKDAQGKIIPLNEPIELAALRRNPLVTADIMAKAEALVPERRKSMERIVIENLDLVEKIDGGLFERTDFGKKESVGEVVDATKPLTTASFATELKNRQIIDDKAFSLNAKITTTYTTDAQPPRDPSASAKDKQAQSMRTLGQIYKGAINEHLWTYDQLMLAAAKEFPAIKTGGEKAETVAAVKAAMAGMTLDQKKDLLRKVAGLPKPEAKAELKPAAEPAGIKSEVKTDAKPGVK